ncbi:MAG: LPXTG cell wall anchor domain-containing protein, partial [Erysipelotrichaceae bacterium]
STTAITSTTGLVKISIVLPVALRTGVKFKMLRLHDGVVEEIATSYNSETFVLTFYTNRFSVYSISYVEGLPDTGNVANYNLLILSMGLVLVLISRRRKFDYLA